MGFVFTVPRENRASQRVIVSIPTVIPSRKTDLWLKLPRFSKQTTTKILLTKLFSNSSEMTWEAVWCADIDVFLRRNRLNPCTTCWATSFSVIGNGRNPDTAEQKTRKRLPDNHNLSSSPLRHKNHSSRSYLMTHRSEKSIEDPLRW